MGRGRDGGAGSPREQGGAPAPLRSASADALRVRSALSLSTHTLFMVRGWLELHFLLLPSSLIKHYMLEASANNEEPWPVHTRTEDKMHRLVAV